MGWRVGHPDRPGASGSRHRRHLGRDPGGVQPGEAGRALRPLASADVHIILTVRDFASVLPAEWQESVKCRGTVPWEQWLDRVITAEPAADRRRRSWFWT